MLTNEMQALYDKHHKVSSLIKVHQNTVTWFCQTWSNYYMKIANDLVIYEVVIEQNLCAFLDLSARGGGGGGGEAIQHERVYCGGTFSCRITTCVSYCKSYLAYFVLAVCLHLAWRWYSCHTFLCIYNQNICTPTRIQQLVYTGVFISWIYRCVWKLMKDNIYQMCPKIG